jgi:uncharacterized protein YndB with AHSA1/START domain
MTQIAGDQARVSVAVAVPPAFAFRIFTEEIDQWWRRGFKYRMAGNNPGIIHLEPKLGGRLFESYETASGTLLKEIGKITEWEPPLRFSFEWRAANFSGSETTSVDVRFEANGRGTLVTVTHRGWSQIRGDHPVRHGLAVPEFIRMQGLWWADLLSALRVHAGTHE